MAHSWSCNWDVHPIDGEDQTSIEFHECQDLGNVDQRHRTMTVVVGEISWHSYTIVEFTIFQFSANSPIGDIFSTMCLTFSKDLPCIAPFHHHSAHTGPSAHQIVALPDLAHVLLREEVHHPISGLISNSPTKQLSRNSKQSVQVTKRSWDISNCGCGDCKEGEMNATSMVVSVCGVGQKLFGLETF